MRAFVRKHYGASVAVSKHTLTLVHQPNQTRAFVIARVDNIIEPELSVRTSSNLGPHYVSEKNTTKKRVAYFIPLWNQCGILVLVCWAFLCPPWDIFHANLVQTDARADS